SPGRFGSLRFIGEGRSGGGPRLNDEDANKGHATRAKELTKRYAHFARQRTGSLCNEQIGRVSGCTAGRLTKIGREPASATHWLRGQPTRRQAAATAIYRARIPGQAAKTRRAAPPRVIPRAPRCADMRPRVAGQKRSAPATAPARSGQPRPRC